MARSIPDFRRAGKVKAKQVFSKILGRSRNDDEIAAKLYGAVVAQARQPDFYRRLGVPDSIDGRLEMILLHLVILFHRLRRDDEAGQAIAQIVFDRFATDMDRSLREMGVGDFGVPKRMKTIGRSFYGRLDGYGRPIAESDWAALRGALQRNLWPDEEGERAEADDLVAYAERAVAELRGQSFEAIAGGEIVFPSPVDALPSEAS